jgi:hypothetical protein
MRNNHITRLAGLVACLLLTISASAQDERAQVVLKQARAALGGTALETVQSLAVSGTSRHFARGSQEQVFEEQFELNFLLPDKFLKITTPPPPPGGSRAPKFTEGLNGDQHWFNVDSQEADVIVAAPDKPVQTIAFKAEIQGDRRAEWARYLLAFLLTTPAGFPVEWSYAGKAELDGRQADALEVKGQAGFAARLLLDEQSHLPLLLSYKSHGGAMGLAFAGGVGAGAGVKVAGIPAPPPGAKIAPADRLQVFEFAVPAVKTKAANEAGFAIAVPPPGAMAEMEMQMRFAEYTSIGGLQLPQRLTITANGQTEAEWDKLIWLPNVVFPADHFQPRKQ